MNTVVLKPSSGWAALHLEDLWKYRELVYFMVWRDVKVRYKQTVLGVAWAILQPFLTMVVFSVFFGGLAKIPTDNNIPYPLFAYAGLLPFTLFTKALNDASRSLVSHQNMITKIYFPRLILPLSSVLGGLVDFGLAFLVLIGMMLFYRFVPGVSSSAFVPTIQLSLLTLPLFLLLVLVAGFGFSLWLSALYVQYRDVGYILPFLSEFWRVVSPLAYSTALVPDQWQVIYSLNPMAGVINGFRWVLLGAPAPVWQQLVVSVVVALLVLTSGLFYFRRMEHTFADTI